MSFQDGEVVGQYRILHKLGHGGMATVFKAYHASLDRYVALKVMHTAFMEDENFLARFDREAKVVANLDHPNIIPIYDFSDHEGSPYFVMKFVEGDTLKHRLSGPPLSQEEGMRIIETVGSALAHAHKQDILHRDIKPSNVMISNSNHIYLTDFGLARIASAGESTLSSDMMLGTPQYISPEQAMGKSELDAGTDIYSLGVLVYELVVGQVPFTADTPYSIVHDHIYTALPLPRAVNPKVPEDVERVLLKALAKERDDRFENVDDFITAFRSASHGEPLAENWVTGEAAVGAAISPSQAATISDSAATIPPEKAEKPSKKKSKGVFRLLSAILVLLLGFVFLAIVGNILNNRMNNNGAEATQPVQIAQGEEPVDDPPQPPPPAAEEGPGDGGDNPGSDFSDDNEFPTDSIASAFEFMEENPDDPFAYLELSAVYYDEGFVDEAMDVYFEAKEVAGEDSEFYSIAAEMFRQRGVWPLVLEATLNAMVFHQGMPPRDTVSSMHQAAYHSASVDTSLGEEILFSELVYQHEREGPVFAGLLAAQARFFLYHGDIEEADALLAEAESYDAKNPMISLVRAELLWELGETDEAVNALLRLTRPNLPNIDSWVRIEAEKLLNLIES